MNKGKKIAHYLQSSGVKIPFLFIKPIVIAALDGINSSLAIASFTFYKLKKTKKLYLVLNALIKFLILFHPEPNYQYSLDSYSSDKTPSLHHLYYLEQNRPEA